MSGMREVNDDVNGDDSTMSILAAVELLLLVGSWDMDSNSNNIMVRCMAR
jgi:hypothetical protein